MFRWEPRRRMPSGPAGRKSCINRPDKRLQPCLNTLNTRGLLAIRDGAHIRSGSEMNRDDMNRDDMANADLTQTVTKQVPVLTMLQLVKATARHLRSVQKQHARIQSHFQHDPVRYAA
jgi:hypothetical protein